jgi:hypothetical protein
VWFGAFFTRDIESFTEDGSVVLMALILEETQRCNIRLSV